MPATQGFSLDDQAKWQLLLEMDRYRRKLRQIESVRQGPSDDLARIACMEHLERVSGIYAAAEAQKGPIALDRPPRRRVDPLTRSASHRHN